jgi:hypothetical protein
MVLVFSGGGVVVGAVPVAVAMVVVVVVMMGSAVPELGLGLMFSSASHWSANG